MAHAERIAAIFGMTTGEYYRMQENLAFSKWMGELPTELPTEPLVRLEALKKMIPVVQHDPAVDDNVVINERGGRQSHVPERYDLVAPAAMKVMAGILGRGAEKYGEDNWRLLTMSDQVNHAIAHLYAFLEQRRLGVAGVEDDLGNALCRVMFAVAMRESERMGV